MHKHFIFTSALLLNIATRNISEEIAINNISMINR